MHIKDRRISSDAQDNYRTCKQIKPGNTTERLPGDQNKNKDQGKQICKKQTDTSKTMIT